MTPEERSALITEQDELRQKIKNASFISPKDYRRIEEITSLLLTSGESSELRFKVGKFKKSQRVTSFTRDRR